MDWYLGWHFSGIWHLGQRMRVTQFSGIEHSTSRATGWMQSGICPTE